MTKCFCKIFWLFFGFCPFRRALHIFLRKNLSSLLGQPVFLISWKEVNFVPFKLYRETNHDSPDIQFISSVRLAREIVSVRNQHDIRDHG